jgi:hypothetical protein
VPRPTKSPWLEPSFFEGRSTFRHRSAATWWEPLPCEVAESPPPLHGRCRADSGDIRAGFATVRWFSRSVAASRGRPSGEVGHYRVYGNRRVSRFFSYLVGVRLRHEVGTCLAQGRASSVRVTDVLAGWVLATLRDRIAAHTSRSVMIAKGRPDSSRIRSWCKGPNRRQMLSSSRLNCRQVCAARSGRARKAETLT